MPMMWDAAFMDETPLRKTGISGHEQMGDS